MVIRYIRKKTPVEKKFKKGEARPEPVGMVVAFDSSHIGWSLCNSVDRWDRERAFLIAEGRAWSQKRSSLNGKMPHTVVPFVDWARRVMEAKERKVV